MQRFTTRLAVYAAVLGLAACALQTPAEADPLPTGENEDGFPDLPQILDDEDRPEAADGKQDKRPVPPPAGNEKDKPVTATGKEDQLPVPPATPPQREHPRPTQGKADREPVPSQLIRRKQPTEETDRLSPSTQDRLTPEAPDPDRLVPDKP